MSTIINHKHIVWSTCAQPVSVNHNNCDSHSQARHSQCEFLSSFASLWRTMTRWMSIVSRRNLMREVSREILFPAVKNVGVSFHGTVEVPFVIKYPMWNGPVFLNQPPEQPSCLYNFTYHYLTETYAQVEFDRDFHPYESRDDQVTEVSFQFWC